MLIEMYRKVVLIEVVLKSLVTEHLSKGRVNRGSIEKKAWSQWLR